MMTREELLDGADRIAKGIEAIKVEFAMRAIEHELARRKNLDDPSTAGMFQTKGEELRQALLIVEKYFPTPSEGVGGYLTAEPKPR